MKTLLELATETVLPEGGLPTEKQENEIEALVKFGKCVLEEAAQQSVQSDTPLASGSECPICGEPVYCVHRDN